MEELYGNPADLVLPSEEMIDKIKENLENAIKNGEIFPGLKSLIDRITRRKCGFLQVGAYVQYCGYHSRSGKYTQCGHEGVR